MTKVKRPPHRPSKLTPDTIDRFAQAIRAGAAWKHAAEFAEIGESTAHMYRQRGEQAVARRAEREKATKVELQEEAKAAGLTIRGSRQDLIERLEAHEQPFVDFLEGATRARAEKRIVLLGHVRKAAETDWRAATWMLAVDDPDTYSVATRSKQEISGPGGGPIQTEDAGQPVRERLKARLYAISERQQEAAAREAEEAG
jgi:hypothetical protein